MAALSDMLVHMHAHGDLGLAAAACQHILLTLPNVAAGSQQTAAMLDGDILAEPIPIATGPRWGRIEALGLGVEVDTERLKIAHERYLSDGEFRPYGDRFDSPPRR